MSGDDAATAGLGTTAAPLDLAVVILNYNGGAQLTTVVAAAAASQGVRLGIVVVDNGSTDDSLAALFAESGAGSEITGRPFVVLPVGENRGFAAGNNLGLFALSARYVALLNNDAVVAPDTFRAMLDFMDRYPRVGACAPQLVWPDGRPQPYSHGSDPSPRYLGRRALSRWNHRPLHDWAGDAPRSVDWVAGTCLVLRVDALARVGMLDERIFMYFEDNELCARLRRQGWGVYFLPEARVRHFNRQSYADRARRANYYRGLSHLYSRLYGRPAGVVMRLLGALRLTLPARRRH